jgi:F0F1-type ATP synthase membrane subunit c/vacuolar-type H+-ATPase subunit K
MACILSIPQHNDSWVGSIGALAEHGFEPAMLTVVNSHLVMAEPVHGDAPLKLRRGSSRNHYKGSIVVFERGVVGFAAKIAVAAASGAAAVVIGNTCSCAADGLARGSAEHETFPMTGTIRSSFLRHARSRTCFPPCVMISAATFREVRGILIINKEELVAAVLGPLQVPREG